MPSFLMGPRERGRAHSAAGRAASGPDTASAEVKGEYVRENGPGLLAQCMGSCYGSDISKGAKADFSVCVCVCICIWATTGPTLLPSCS